MLSSPTGTSRGIPSVSEEVSDSETSGREPRLASKGGTQVPHSKIGSALTSECGITIPPCYRKPIATGHSLCVYNEARCAGGGGKTLKSWNLKFEHDAGWDGGFEIRNLRARAEARGQKRNRGSALQNGWGERHSAPVISWFDVECGIMIPPCTGGGGKTLKS
ncbi:hypothetical protein GALL_96110 [mine drainage metagenome]|uniref:Uncharacterized protein n=1 Tax=mine drainage metagenome TaxID=410659 RepID=A0A1J5SVL6_9ZZZZ